MQCLIMQVTAIIPVTVNLLSLSIVIVASVFSFAQSLAYYLLSWLFCIFFQQQLLFISSNFIYYVNYSDLLSHSQFIVIIGACCFVFFA